MLANVNLTMNLGATYPILAFVFAKVLDVFQIQPTSKMVEKGDFYALMFFVLALVILVVYHFTKGDTMADRGPIRIIQWAGIAPALSSFPVIVFAYTCHQNVRI